MFLYKRRFHRFAFFNLFDRIYINLKYLSFTDYLMLLTDRRVQN